MLSSTTSHYKSGLHVVMDEDAADVPGPAHYLDSFPFCFFFLFFDHSNSRVRSTGYGERGGGGEELVSKRVSSHWRAHLCPLSHPPSFLPSFHNTPLLDLRISILIPLSSPRRHRALSVSQHKCLFSNYSTLEPRLLWSSSSR